MSKGISKLLGLKSSLGGMFSQLSTMFGMGDTDITGNLETLKSTIELISSQFKNADMTTFVCVCIAEFLSLYETERLVQELTKMGMDTHNIVVNQLVTPDSGKFMRSLKDYNRLGLIVLEIF